MGQWIPGVGDASGLVKDSERQRYIDVYRTLDDPCPGHRPGRWTREQSREHDEDGSNHRGQSTGCTAL